MGYIQGYTPTPSQQWQRKRRMQKGLLSSSKGTYNYLLNIDKSTLTMDEKLKIIRILKEIESVLIFWSDNDSKSKENYLRKELV